jgi:3-methyladenine DNA glycosylase AlkD
LAGKTKSKKNSFRNHRLRDFVVAMSINWLLNDIAKATPSAVDELCLVYRHAIDQDHI